MHCTKKGFPLRILSVNVTKSSVSCGFGTFTGKILNGKLYFLSSDISAKNILFNP